MQHKRNPWVSIADLLSSVVLILLLLYVMASIVPKFTQEAKQNDMMKQLQDTLTEYEDKGQLQVHIDTGTLEFTSITFESGSAEVTGDTKKLITDLAQKVKLYMDTQEKMEILVEGHTDPAVIHDVLNRGGYFADNVQLSTLRAANVRKEMLANMGTQYAQRIGVSGYGDTRLKNKDNPLSAENRRIEIRILWNGQDKK